MAEKKMGQSNRSLFYPSVGGVSVKFLKGLMGRTIVEDALLQLTSSFKKNV